MKLNKIEFNKAREILKEGDVLLFRGDSVVAHFIKRATEGKYTHVGVASAHGANGGKIWECVEFREWKGGRTVNLDTYVNTSREIDVFRPAQKKQVFNMDMDKSEVTLNVKDLDTKLVTNTMRKMTGLPYGWSRIAWIAQHKIPLLRWLYSINSIVQDSTELVYPVCSSAVAYAFSHAGFDLTHHRSDNYTEPSDIARSALLHYVFTLIP